jgi:hypothetical protein
LAEIAALAAGTKVGNSLDEFLMLPELKPGDEPSYKACQIVFAYHPLGAKMAETPVALAQSQERELTCPAAPTMALTAFKDEHKAMGSSEAIRQTKVLSRVYGIASLGVVAEGVPPNYALTPMQMRGLRIAFNVYDPLNTAGSLVFNQNPLALDFMKQKDTITVNGASFHPSRSITVINERPLYLLWTNSGFGFVGRSCYQRAWYPLKSFLKTMTTDDMIATKAGVIVAKIKQAGSFADNLMATATGQKRNVVKEAQVGNVINVGIDEAIESLNLINLEGPMTMARSNILKNCATAADMPALILNEESYVEGFGEGTEDAKRVAQYVKGLRVEMNPLYDWFDQMAMYRAWSPELYTAIQRRYPQVYGQIGYTQAFYGWKNSFKAEWPNLLEEPDSDKIRTQEVVLRSACAAAEVLLPLSDPSNQVSIAMWLADTFNDQTALFKTPLEINVDDMEAYLQKQQSQMEDQQEAQNQALQQGQMGQPGQGGPGGGGGGGDGDKGGPPGFQQPKLPKPKTGGFGGGDSRNDRISAALNALHDSVDRLPKGSPLRARTHKLMDGLARRSGVRPNGNGGMA